MTPEEIDAATPPDRYRYADLLRVASILVVVFGHWLLLVVTVQDGKVAYGTMLDVVPWTQWLTWILQVMPVFFMVGGYANALSLDSAHRKGTRGVDWVRARALRLYWPLLPVLAVWLVLSVALVALGTATDVVDLSTQVVLVPAWFLAAYLAVVSLAPVTHAWHRKWGWGALATLVALAVAADVANRFFGVPFVGWTTYVWVWAAVHQVGYFWQEGRLPRGVGARLGITAAGYLALAALVFGAGYQLAMVGGGGTGDNAGQTNTTPPSIALIALAAGQLGLLLAAEGPVSRLAHKPRVWAAVVTMGTLIMTVYLWHMSAMVAVAAAAFPTGLWPAMDPTSMIFWLTRPLWFAALLVVLAVLVVAFRRFEHAPDAVPTTVPGRAARVKATLGVLATCAGLALLVLGGLYSDKGPLGVPIVPVALFVAGLVALGVIRFGGRRAPKE
jgi:surface polysaccharide O-acyltransferase-like enzyme